MQVKKVHPLLLLLLIVVALVIWWICANVSKNLDQKSADVHFAFPIAPTPDRSVLTPLKQNYNARYVPANDVILPQYENGGEYVLMGKISSVSGEAISRAAVTLFGSAPVGPQREFPVSLAAVNSDVSGRYFIHFASPIPNGYLRIEREGYASLESAVSIREPGTQVTNFELSPASACVEGTVSSSDGVPIRGASVGLVSYPTSLAPARFVATSQVTSQVQMFSDQEGRFRIGGMPEGVLLVNTSARNFVPTMKRIAAKSGPCERVDLQLSAARSVLISVKSKGGSAIQNAQLMKDFTRPDASKFLGVPVIRKTEDGTMLEWIVPLDFKESVGFIVQASGYRPQTTMLDPQIPLSEVVLEDADIITGRVVSESGQPVAQALVRAAGVTEVVYTDFDGTFSIPGATSILTRNITWNQITAQKTGYVEQVVTLANGIPPLVTIRLHRSSAGVFGKVIDDSGKPVQKFLITLKQVTDQNPGMFERWFDDEEGRFCVSDVPSGFYSAVIQSWKEEPVQAELSDLEVKSGMYYGEILVNLPAPAAKK